MEDIRGELIDAVKAKWERMRHSPAKFVPSALWLCEYPPHQQSTGADPTPVAVWYFDASGMHERSVADWLAFATSPEYRKEAGKRSFTWQTALARFQHDVSDDSWTLSVMVGPRSGESERWTCIEGGYHIWKIYI